LTLPNTEYGAIKLKTERAILSDLTKTAFYMILAGAFWVAVVAHGTQSEPAAVLVRTRQGLVQGLVAGNVEQFHGIPYALPPLDSLRWRPPLPPRPYVGVLHATNFPSPCMQARPVAGFAPPSEDCLYLNVYRPLRSNEGKRTPVLIYIHGGGFEAGTASTRDGVQLAAGNNIIVVMVNYRLDAFGWLALPELDSETANGSSSGNYGLLDILTAVRWVHDNIAAFGGDPDNVTIAGTSAGGIAVCALLTARLHERIFRRAIIESGECTRSSAYITSHRDALLHGTKFAANARCTDAAKFASCLRSNPATTLLSASERSGPFTSNIGGSLMPNAPIEAIESGELERIPVIVGANHDEQRRSPLETVGFPATEQSYHKYLTDAFGPLGPLVALQYPSAAFVDPSYAAGAVASDSGVPNGIGVCPMLVELARALAKFNQTFAYELSDPHGSGVADSAGFEPGSLHTAEIGFLYSQVAPVWHTPEQVQMATRMQRYWATFVQNGRPNDGSHDWPSLSSGSILRFQPSGDFLVPTRSFSEDHHCEFWAGLGY
jgi:para-nitrobenzyl esterase